MKIIKIGKIENGNKLEKITMIPCCEMGDFDPAICSYPRYT